MKSLNFFDDVTIGPLFELLCISKTPKPWLVLPLYSMNVHIDTVVCVKNTAQKPLRILH